VDLPEDLIALLRQPSPCFVATVMPDGSPQLTQTWVDTDGKHVIINTVQGFQKLKNVEREPRVAVSVAGPARPSRYYEIRGQVVDVTTEGGTEHIEASPSATWAALTRGMGAATRSASSSPSARTRSAGWGNQATLQLGHAGGRAL
jgi:PPOX class probable F420-dependent enzyme